MAGEVNRAAGQAKDEVCDERWLYFGSAPSSFRSREAGPRKVRVDDLEDERWLYFGPGGAPLSGSVEIDPIEGEVVDPDKNSENSDGASEDKKEK